MENAICETVRYISILHTVFDIFLYSYNTNVNSLYSKTYVYQIVKKTVNESLFVKLKSLYSSYGIYISSIILVFYFISCRNFDIFYSLQSIVSIFHTQKIITNLCLYKLLTFFYYPLFY